MIFQAGAGPRLELDEGSALDIGSCLVDGVEVAPGTAVPDDGDPRILHAVGGFLFTCGPDHIRHPEPIGNGHAGKWPLHGSMAGHRGEILSENRDGPCLEVRARIEIAHADGARSAVNRLWRMNEATGETMLEDDLVNIGDRPFVPMWMYHMNLGAHLFGPETRIESAAFQDGSVSWRFGEGDGHVFCVPAAREAGSGFARLVLGPIPGLGGKSLTVLFDTATLPHLQMWRNEALPANVIGIEPVSHPWKKREELAGMGLMETLEPGASRRFVIGFGFS